MGEIPYPAKLAFLFVSRQAQNPKWTIWEVKSFFAKLIYLGVCGVMFKFLRLKDLKPGRTIVEIKLGNGWWLRFGSVVYVHLFTFFLHLRGQLSFRNSYFYRFLCHHPLITHLNFTHNILQEFFPLYFKMSHLKFKYLLESSISTLLQICFKLQFVSYQFCTISKCFKQLSSI